METMFAHVNVWRRENAGEIGKWEEKRFDLLTGIDCHLTLSCNS